MISRSIPAMAMLAAGGLIVSTPVAAQRVEVGNAATVVGEVKVSNAEIKRPRQIARKQRIAWGDLIATGKKSQLQILLLDRSTFGVGASASVRIDRYVYNPNEGRSFFATVTKGALRFFSGRTEGSNSGEIQTPSGRIGIRGTAVDLLVGKDAKKIAEKEDSLGKTSSKKDEAVLVVLRGPGAATEGGLPPGVAEVEAAGKTVLLDRPGLAAYIPFNGSPPIGPFAISDAGLADLQDEHAPEVARSMNDGGFLKTLIPVAAAAITVGVIMSGDGNDDNGQQGGQPGAGQPQGGQTQGTQPGPNNQNPGKP